MSWTDWATLNDSPDDSADQQPAIGARAIDLNELLPILTAPQSTVRLKLSGDHLIADDGEVFPIREGRPVLFPSGVLHLLDGDNLRAPNQGLGSALEQYLYLHEVKNLGGNFNSPPDDPWFAKHLSRSRRLFREAKGLVLDVGCDNPELSRSLLPASAAYVGLEPAFGRAPGFRLVGMAEFLPFADHSLDGVSFMTSLDHILDYHRAIDEAFRVLKPGGDLFLATLIWTKSAELYNDSIHFHHFRQFEIEGVLRRFEPRSATRYNWKDSSNRFGVYLHARKPG